MFLFYCTVGLIVKL